MSWPVVSKMIADPTLVALLSVAMVMPSLAARADGVRDYKTDVEPVLKNYCFDCHGDGASKGDVAFDDYTNISAHVSNQKLWLAVWQNLQTQMMPPARKAQPSDAERRRLIEWIERDVFKLDPINPDPGRVTIRRLNREEYRNTILDLFGIEYDTTDAFPADDAGYGFDNIGDVLTMSPLLMEKYLDAAQEITGKLVNTDKARIPTLIVKGDQFQSKTDEKLTARNLPLGDTNTVQCTREITHHGPYKITVDLAVLGAESAASVQSATLVLMVDGRELERRDLGWDHRKDISLSAETPFKNGKHTLALQIIPKRAPNEGESRLYANVDVMSLHGPLDRSFLEHPKDYYRVFLDGPAPRAARARREYARKILRHFADRAFRRSVDEPTLAKLAGIADSVARQPGATFEQAIGEGLTAILASPRFLFRAEIQPEPNNPARIVPVDEFALASRLSYFLWSSLPDEELFTLAREGKLRANLRAQVDRMLKDDKGKRFVRNFTGQWLQTRDVETIAIDAQRILRTRKGEDAEKIFNGRIRRAMRAETEMMFGYLVKENRPMTELVAADYTFLNEALAGFYGIDGVKGSEMRKVSLKPDSHRGGLLTQGSFLLVTSNPTRTSPVKRGLFVLDNLLGTPAPPPPPNVPPLEKTRRNADRFLTMRESMELHREKPLCASCHARMDPIGLALENFNALGRYRDMDGDKPIDTGGQLITGEKFTNTVELARILVTSRRKDFYRCVTEKLLTYATGRGVEYYDAPTVEKIMAQLERDGGKTRTLLYGVVESAPFQKRRGDGDRLLTEAKND